jgi:hypothetical protein
MKTLQEIFATNPDLLKEKEVVELTKQFAIQFKTIQNNHWDYWDKVTTLTMNSELFVIKGMSCEEVVKIINEIEFNEI